MLAVETRASMGVGVAISVTTIPAAAFLGVAAGIGEFSKSLSALSVLGTNVAMMLVGGSIVVAIQRRLAPRAD
jgi:predicted DNA repair protein MutK